MLGMLKLIIPFELKYRFKNPLTLLIFAAMIFQGIWCTSGIYDYYINDATYRNAAGIFYSALAGGGMLFVVIVAMITATTLYRDIESKSADYIYSYPMQEKPFFIAHFLAAWLINIIIMLGYAFGLVLVKYSGIASADQMGPIPWLQIIHGYLLFTIPNLLTYNAICFFCLVVARRMTAVYAGIALVTVLFVTGEGLSANTPYLDLVCIFDPFAYVYSKTQVDLMSVVDKNSAFMPLNSVFWINRSLWLCVDLVLAWVAYKRFSFKYFLQIPGMKKVRKESELPVDLASHAFQTSIPQVSLRFGLLASFKKILRMSWMEFRNVTRPPVFKVVMALLIIMVLANDFIWNSTYYVGYQYPITSGMTNTRLSGGFMYIIVLMILSGELFFKERKTNFWQITGATSASIWELNLPKLFAMFAVAFVFAFTIFAGGVFAQLIQGFHQIDWFLYLDDVFGYKWGWVNYMFFIVMVFCLAGITGNRFVTHCVGVGYFVFLLISLDMGILEEIRYAYGIIPGVEDFSEINRYGILSVSSFWFCMLWVCMSIVLVIVGLHFWRRGTDQSILSRLKWRSGEIPMLGRIGLIVALGAFIFVQNVIQKNVYEPRNYIPTDQSDYEAACYENTYKSLLSDYDIKTSVSSLNVDLFPYGRCARMDMKLAFRNEGEKPIDKLYLNADSFTQINSIVIPENRVKLLERNVPLGMYVYRLNKALLPGESVPVEIQAQRQHTGFTQSGDDTEPELAFDGLFFTDIVPVVGYDEDKELDENRIRREQGLPVIDSRMASVDESKPYENFLTNLTPDSTVVTLTVSTDSSQIPIAPGVLDEMVTDEGRTTATYKLNCSNALQLYVGSGAYAERKIMLEGVTVCYYYHPKHDYNLEYFDECIAYTLKFMRKNLGEYPYESVRIAEIPYYQDAAYVSNRFIALSEKEGWYGDIGVDEIKAFIQFSLSRDLIRQYLDTYGRIADVQGADMLWTALPSALAFQVVQESQGDASVNELLSKNLRKYGKDRNNEANQEHPLLYADNAEYLEPVKGSLAMYTLSKSIGFNAINQQIKAWLEIHRNTQMTFADFYGYIKETNELNPHTIRLFETVDETFNL
jgi:hypothetical protein